MRLAELKEGEKGIITKVIGRGTFRKRLIEMGFVHGKEVKVVKYAPLKDPIEYNIMGYLVSLRKSEATLVEIVSESEVSSIVDGPEIVVNIERELRNLANVKSKTINVALVGNPNCGKTTMFNYLTGSYEHVGNYSGVTVDAKQGSTNFKNYTLNIIDLPGTYSLSAYTPEELYVREYILEQMPDIIVNVVEAPNLERNLYLTTQLIDMGVSIVMALNMYDEFEAAGNKLDIDLFSQLLGLAIVPTVAAKNKGLDVLLDKIVDTYNNIEPNLRHIHINYGKETENCINDLQKELKKPHNKWLTNTVSTRFLSIKLLENDKHAKDLVSKCLKGNKIVELSENLQKKIGQHLKDDTETILANYRYGFIAGSLRESFIEGTIDRFFKSTRIDRLLTHKYLGIPIFLALLYLTFLATFKLGQYPMEWIDSLVMFIQNLVVKFMPAGMLKDLIVDGIIKGVGSVIVFLPNILILFFFISLMEDTGYMARVAFIMDKLMHKIGLHGKSFIPLLMGFGCNVPAIMATRTIENRNDRILTMLINPFMSCSARLPVYMIIISAIFSAYKSLALFGIYIFGVSIGIFLALIFKKTIFRHKEAPFVMELPPYRMPTTIAVSKHLWHKSSSYLKKMTTVILFASIIVWSLGYFPQNKKLTGQYDSKIENLKSEYSVLISKNPTNSKLLQDRDQKVILLQNEALEVHFKRSFIGIIGKTFEPIMRPLGFDWKMTVALIAATPAKEIAVSTLGVLYQSPDNSSLVENIRNATYTGGSKIGQKIFSPANSAAFLVFVLLYFPCIATIAVIKQETNSFKWAAFVMVYTTVVAYVAAFIVKNLISIF